MTATERIDGQLQSGEKLLWRGRPRPGLIFRPQQVLPMIVGVSVLLAAGWLLAALLRGPSVWIGFVICAAFAAVGLYLTFGIVAIDVRRRGSTCYAVTDRRIIIQSESPFGYVGSLGLLHLNGKPQTLKIGADGTIHFGYPLFSYVANFWGPLDRMGVSFPRLECPENPLRVYRVIRRAQRRLIAGG